MTKGLIGRLLGDEEISSKTASEPLSQLRDPTLDERASLYLRAVHGKQDFGSEAYSDARNRILNAMATDTAVQLGNDLPDTSETLHPLSRRPYEYGYTAARAAYSDEPLMAAAMATPRYAEMASPRYMNEEDFAAAAPNSQKITPPRRQPFKFSLRTIGTLSIIVCAAALIAGAGTLLFFRNENSSLAWFAQPQQSSKTEVAVRSSGSNSGSLMPATVQPRMVTSKSPGQQPSPEELAELEQIPLDFTHSLRA